MKLRLPCLAATAALSTILAPRSHAALGDGLVAYWPLDEIQGTRTPDLVNGYDLTLSNLTANEMVAGKFGKCFTFTGGKQTLLSRKANSGDKIPVNDQHTAWSVALWVKGTGTGQTDWRVFSEGSTDNATPLFNIGTDSGGASDSVDIFIRGNNGTVDHRKSVNMGFDNTWRLIVWTQNGNDKVALYIDGVKDEIDIAAGVSPLSNPTNAYKVNTTSVGGILRATPSHWWTGLIDDVAQWQRELSPAEVTQLFKEGMSSVKFGGGASDPLAAGMVAYWPLDELVAGKAPDLVNGYDLSAANLTASDVVAGKFGKAFSFTASKQTLLSRKANPGDKIPVNDLHAAWSVSLWVKGTGTGQNDLRVFSEGSTDNATPLFNIGTDSTGASDSVDIFIRGNNGTVDHRKSLNMAFDNAWRHIAWTQNGNDKLALYVDGVKDDIDIAAGVSPLSNPTNAYKVNTTSVGGILRATPSHWWTGLIDDVAQWQRELSAEEVKALFTKGTPKPSVATQPLEIRAFASERGKAAKGTKAILTWEGSKDASYEINGQDVTAQTLFGSGRAEFVIDKETKYTLTAKRGAETKTKDVTVKVLEGVQPGWFLLEDFEIWNTGALGVATGGVWPEPDSAKLKLATSGGNKFLAADAGQAMTFTRLGSYETPDGATRSYHFQLYLKGDKSAIETTLGVTKKVLRFANNENDAELGGFIVVRRAEGETDGEIGIGPAANENFSKTKLAPNTWYKVWLDITNAKGEDLDTISVHLAKGTEARTTLFNKEMGDAGTPFQHSFFFIAPRETTTGEQAMWIDNVFLSVETAPLATNPLGSGGVVVGPGDSDGDGQSDASEVLAGTDPKNPADYFRIVKVETTAKGGKVTWDAKAGKTYEIEYSESLLGGSWTVVGPNLSGNSATAWEDGDAARLGRGKGFYRVRIKG